MIIALHEYKGLMLFSWSILINFEVIIAKICQNVIYYNIHIHYERLVLF